MIEPPSHGERLNVASALNPCPTCGAEARIAIHEHAVVWQCCGHPLPAARYKRRAA